MIGFNLFLQHASVALSKARLVRHQDARALPGRSPYNLWVAGTGDFEQYQRVQSKPRFKDVDWIASFVATPLEETMFVGLYRVTGVGAVPPGTKDSARGVDVGGLFLYDLILDEALKDYGGRIVIEWGTGYRSWIQRPDRQDKSVIEMRRTRSDPVFPGFVAFSWPMNALATVPTSWRGALSAVSGVYLLACRNTGRHYVGSAYGAGGFWARWEAYLQSGHGGNEGMRSLLGHDYQVSILEVASSSLSPDEVIAMEVRWKEKLLSREFGLNRN